MFEESIALLGEHIDYLRQYLSGDMEEMPSRDELEDKLFQFRCDIDTLRLDLPYDALDESDDPIDCSISDMWHNDELEDVVTEAEAIIDELEELIIEAETVDMTADEEPSEEADSFYIGDVTAPTDVHADANSHSQSFRVHPTCAPFTPIHFWARLLDWIRQTFIRKYELSGHAIPSDDELDRMTMCCACMGKANRNVDKAVACAKELFPGYRFEEEEFKDIQSHHLEILVVANETIKRYEIGRDIFNFDRSIRFYSECSFNLFHKEYLKPQ